MVETGGWLCGWVTDKCARELAVVWICAVEAVADYRRAYIAD